MGDLFGIGATVQGAAQATAAGLNYASQMNYNKRYTEGIRETNATNIKLAREQNAWNLAQWNRENEYNDPSAQGQRLRDAGLSAAAAAQQVSGGQASPLQSADLSVAQAPQPLQAPQLDVSGVNIIGIARALEDLRQSKIETKMQQNEYEAQPDKLLCEQQLRELQVKQSQEDLKQSIALNPYHLESLKADVYLKRQQRRNYRMQYKIMRQNWFTAKKEYGWIDQIKQAEWQKILSEIRSIDESTRNAKKQGKLLDQTYSRNEILRVFDKYGGIPDNFAGRLAILFSEGVLKPEDVEENVQTMMNVGEWLLKGVRTNLLPQAIKVVNALIFGDNSDEVDAMIAEYKKRKQAAEKAGEHEMGHSTDPGYEPYE